MAESAKINPREKGNPNICVSNRRKSLFSEYREYTVYNFILYNKDTNANQSNI